MLREEDPPPLPHLMQHSPYNARHTNTSPRYCTEHRFDTLVILSMMNKMCFCGNDSINCNCNIAQNQGQEHFLPLTANSSTFANLWIMLLLSWQIVVWIVIFADREITQSLQRVQNLLKSKQFSGQLFNHTLRTKDTHIRFRYSSNPPCLHHLHCWNPDHYHYHPDHHEH